MVKSCAAHGIHTVTNVLSLVTNCALPFEERSTLPYVFPYNWKLNGRVTVVMQSSQCLPLSVVPATMVSVPAVIVYWLPGQGVRVAVGVGVGVGEAVGVGVGL